MISKPPIDLAFCWAFPDCTPLEGLRHLKECGFDGIELWPNYLEKFGVSTWAQALEEVGMRCFQLCPYFNFVHGPEKVSASAQMLTDYLEHALVLNCHKLRVFTGPPWGEGVVGSKDATPHQWESAIEHLRRYCDIAAPQGVELCLECHGGSLMEDAPSSLRLLRGVHRPNLTVNLQLPLLEEDWQVSLEALAPYTTHIHIHNWEKEMGQDPLTFLGEGVFDWAPVVQHLQEAGKHICLSVEHSDHGGRHEAWETARRDGPYLNELRARFL